MKKQKQRDNLKDMIVNNPRATERIEIKRINKEISEIDKQFDSRDKFKNSLWSI
jgi:hypothetical protein